MDVRAVDSGAACMEEVRRNPPDLIVLDLGLPDADGTEICRQIRAETQCYVLMLTARAEEVDLLIGLAVGADGYMAKPFSPRELVARVRSDSGAACMEEVRRNPPDLIVLDLGLPDADGTEICRQIRAETQCYVLMLTARAEEVDLLIGLAVGADGYMAKPFSPRELVARV